MPGNRSLHLESGSRQFEQGSPLFYLSLSSWLGLYSFFDVRFRYLFMAAMALTALTEEGKTGTQ